MQSAFPFVVFGAVALSVVMSFVFLLTRGSGSIYDQIEQGNLSSGAGPGGGPPAPAPDSPAGRAEQEREIRQMLSARSQRLVRRGQPALDIDAEVARLLEPAHSDPRSAGGHDAGLVEEVRQLVVARNERRARKGQEPLDVEAEIARTLAELDP
jgi:hypothetical protein